MEVRHLRTRRWARRERAAHAGIYNLGEYQKLLVLFGAFRFAFWRCLCAKTNAKERRNHWTEWEKKLQKSETASYCSPRRAFVSGFLLGSANVPVPSTLTWCKYWIFSAPRCPSWAVTVLLGKFCRGAAFVDWNWLENFLRPYVARVTTCLLGIKLEVSQFRSEAMGIQGTTLEDFCCVADSEAFSASKKEICFTYHRNPKWYLIFSNDFISIGCEGRGSEK